MEDLIISCLTMFNLIIYTLVNIIKKCIIIKSGKIHLIFRLGYFVVHAIIKQHLIKFSKFTIPVAI